MQLDRSSSQGNSLPRFPLRRCPLHFGTISSETLRFCLILYAEVFCGPISSDLLQFRTFSFPGDGKPSPKKKPEWEAAPLDVFPGPALYLEVT